jgi:hypothetical protein
VAARPAAGAPATRAPTWIEHAEHEGATAPRGRQLLAAAAGPFSGRQPQHICSQRGRTFLRPQATSDSVFFTGGSRITNATLPIPGVPAAAAWFVRITLVNSALQPHLVFGAARTAQALSISCPPDSLQQLFPQERQRRLEPCFISSFCAGNTSGGSGGHTANASQHLTAFSPSRFGFALRPQAESLAPAATACNDDSRCVSPEAQACSTRSAPAARLPPSAAAP